MKKILLRFLVFTCLISFAISCDDESYSGPCRLKGFKDNEFTIEFKYNAQGLIESYPLKWLGSTCQVTFTYNSDGSLATRRYSCGNITESTYSYPKAGVVSEDQKIYSQGQFTVRPRTYFYSVDNRIDSVYVGDGSSMYKIYLTYANGNLSRYFEDGPQKVEFFNYKYDDQISPGLAFCEATGKIPLIFPFTGDFYSDPSMHSENNATSFEYRRYVFNDGMMNILAHHDIQLIYSYSASGLVTGVSSPGNDPSTKYLYEGCP